MKISLYTNRSEPNRANKKLVHITDIENAKVTNEANLLNVTITLKRDIISDVNAVNYVYIDSFKRYYFATTTIENGFIILNCQVDVLSTYINEIKNLTATITRNENRKNGYLNDSEYNIYAYEQVVCKSFSKGLTSDSLILMTVG